METLQGGKTKGRMKTKISRILGVGVTLALLTSLLVGALPAAAVSVPQLTIPTVGDNVINTVNADYNVYFALTDHQLNAGDTISIQFPAGYTVAAGITAGISAGQGWISPPTPATEQAAVVAGVTFAGTPATRTVTATLAGVDVIGEFAQVRIEITGGITNPSATGDYAVAVSTSQELVPVSSNTVTLVAPVIPPLPGVVTGYNSAGETLFQSNSGTAIVNALATAGVVRVTLTTGTYTENPAIGAGQTIVSTDGAASAIIVGTVTLTTATSVLDAVTVTTGGVVGAAAGASVRNCILSGNPALNVTASTTSTGNTIAAGAGALNGIQVNGGTCTSTGDTINVAATGTGINVLGGAAPPASALVLSSATVTGASGTGLTNAAAVTATVTGSTFSNLNVAVNATAGTVNISTSTIDGCGFASATVPTGAFQIAGGVVGAMANTITNGPNAIARVAAGGTGVGSSFKFNTLTGNTASFVNVVAGILDATNNWWGSSAGPTVASSPVVAGVGVITSPWLIAEVTNPTVLYGAASVGTSHPAAQATSGVTVAMFTAGVASFNMNVIATGNYDGNPVTAEPPADTVRSFEVYVQGPAAAMLADTAVITFFGITSPLAQVWGYSANQDTWVLCTNQRVDMFAGTVVVTVNGVNVAPLTSPNLGNMAGLEFVLTEPTAAPPAVPAAPAQGTMVPAQAETGVDVELTSFSWAAVAGATSYDFELAVYLAGSADPFIPSLTILSENLETNGIILLTEVLDYLETYAWRVRGVNAIGEGNWTTGFFTTMAEPEEPPADPVWIIEQEPTQIEWPDNITIEVPPIDQPEIPEYILWVVVAVGAILVIAVIVLIVRTRRVA
jgi:hypothetical protein